VGVECGRYGFSAEIGISHGREERRKREEKKEKEEKKRRREGKGRKEEKGETTTKKTDLTGVF
jgi:hypothetical protein